MDWQFWIDRGGTFTDIVARRPDGALVTHKLLSENPEQYRDAAVAGIRHLLGPGARRADPGRRRSKRSRWAPRSPPTRCWSARASRPLLAITRGFRDALRIAYQNRPRLFDRHIVLPELLYARVVEIDERIGAHGEVRAAARRGGRARRALQDAYDAGLRALAIVLHARLPLHRRTKRAVARIARDDRLHAGLGLARRSAR